MEGLRQVSRIHKGIEINIRMRELTDGYGFPEQFLYVRLRELDTGKLVQWSGTSRRWQFQMEELVSELQDGSEECGTAEQLHDKVKGLVRKKRWKEL